MKKAFQLSLMLAVMLLMGVSCDKDHNNHNNEEPVVNVTTYAPHDITAANAICGVEVSVMGDVQIREIGVCWSVSPNPEVRDYHLSTTNCKEPFICTIGGLQARTMYCIRAYAIDNSDRSYYGEEKSFTTETSGGGGGIINGHAYIDLGLPSGTLWATCNLGSATPEGFGDYYAWGETSPKPTYDWNTYQHCNGYSNQLTKYCNTASYGYNGFTDQLSELLPVDDAATVHWGEGWRMPTKTEWDELTQCTTNSWTTKCGVNGWFYTGPNGNTLFIPAAGCRDDVYSDNEGHYWASSLNLYWPECAYDLFFYSSYYEVSHFYRYRGCAIRPVCSAPQR